MSEIRTVSVKMSKQESVEKALKKVGIKHTVNNRNFILERDSVTQILNKLNGRAGYIYGNSISLNYNESTGNYVLTGDTNKADLDVIAKELEAFYALERCIETAQNDGYYLEEEPVVEGDVIRLRIMKY